MDFALSTDLYQLTMMQGYLREGKQEQKAIFDLFFRQLPWHNGYAVAAGLEQAINYVTSWHFTDEHISYLRSLNMFDAEFLAYLADLRFTGDIAAIPEGTVVFPHEPLLQVSGPLGVVQYIETPLLSIINHQTLIATKAARVTAAAGSDPVMEFGLRRAHGPEAGLYGARAAVIGGCTSTSNVLAGQQFGIPVSGTMAHSWIMSFPSELEAFRAYAAAFPQGCLLLVDTYDTLRSGVPNAIQVGHELRQRGYELLGVRLDSGDIAYLSKEVRRMLDAAGFTQAKIVASNDLDEELIQDLKVQEARIDIWGVGTKLITAEGQSALGGVYKMVGLEENGALAPKLKLSENAEKTTNPGEKQVYRFYDKDTGKALADLVCLMGETIDTNQPITIFDPIETWKKKTLTNFTVRPLLEPVVVAGKRQQAPQSVLEIRSYSLQDRQTLWPEYHRLKNPPEYYVDLSQSLWDLKEKLIREHTAKG